MSKTQPKIIEELETVSVPRNIMLFCKLKAKDHQECVFRRKGVAGVARSPRLYVRDC
jgi:hypothetical protein